jgi:hypothetical protein
MKLTRVARASLQSREGLRRQDHANESSSRHNHSQHVGLYAIPYAEWGVAAELERNSSNIMSDRPRLESNFFSLSRPSGTNVLELLPSVLNLTSGTDDNWLETILQRLVSERAVQRPGQRQCFRK